MTSPDCLSGDKVVVGYIQKAGYLDRGEYYTAIGPVKLYSFADAIPLRVLGESPTFGEVKLNQMQITTILDHFKDKKPVTENCIEEIPARKADVNDNKSSEVC